MTTKQKTKTKALDVAFYFIKKGKEEKKPITNKKLQKLVYYAQAWSLVLNNEKLFNEKIEAWIHGPAIPSLYEKFMQFGSDPINLEMDKWKSNISKKQENVLDNVWRVYGKYDADYLEILTHSEIPWQEAREGLQSFESSKNEISLKTMKNYYSEILKKVQKRK
jgi:uncharacterized phage-associated protein